MGKQIPISTSFELPDGRVVSIETGKLATQANGSVVVRVGKTMLFAVVTASENAGEKNSFFPLSVDYQEKFAAAGKIPGNFFKREAKLSDYEVLISRLVDRAIRPLFPDNYMSETQIIVNLISGEAEVLPDSFVALAASAAIMVSDVPFLGPISEVRVARIDGKFVINPMRSELERADIDIIVGATIQDVTMVEGEAKECLEADLVEAIKVGHEAIKSQCLAQLKLVEILGGVTKRALAEIPENDEVNATVKAFVTEPILAIARAALDKKSRKEGFKKIEKDLNEHLRATQSEEYLAQNADFISRYYSKAQKEIVRRVILNEGIRLDGRKPTDIRPIWVEVDYLPATHGSAIFNRGETQSLTSLTLGSKLDELMIDTAMNLYFEKFILHYNFPGFSVGEVKPQRSPGRREVGHANLAGRSLRQILPKDFPYTVRIVSDILESNGSSSMATVCAGSLALLDGGVPVSAPISGIAMGLVSDGSRTQILSDILGDEDALGDMDFKVTGTSKGICGCQMDIKIDGMPYDLLEKALLQAKEGRLHILNEMNRVIDQPRPDLKPHAPRITTVEVDREFIGPIIGPGGKNIQELQRRTHTVINIEEVNEKGLVTIASTNAEGMAAAVKHIKGIAQKPEIGEVYEGEVVSVQAYGVFVEFLPGKSGLLHISEVSWSRLETLDGVLAPGDPIKIKLIGLDEKTGKFRLSRKVLMDKPANYKERDDNNGGGGGGGSFGGGGKDFRGGGGGGNRNRR